ncbi:MULTISPECIES: NAD(P)-dependent alcohol dehydrogenase [unclassified Rhizobium]|uniref:NAD(P)-dependent alcohol dehydrogenase n=1 Tax=unclassified Rhizobium TaxID=2613769 RepID=UPI00160D3E02|nr:MULTISPECIES: NAD(P)-dependent alcohol dehydrogenase [unclassified Rhizobium]MBB3381972.1 putative zinc-type alcohol dehydrogenase-like protein [Rhizobium sp. BK098]MBB3613674.1 putative zinc-type alcohol dehydrogenase-like protein [Rhizobium sp. BK609]MBB3679332.1 putative zinc-type alcohol dehydrogenase-like protein [Rhizobium sp. BK612]
MPIAKGYAATDASKPLTPFTFDRRDPNADDVLISVKYCGVCHSDIHQARNEWGGSKYPMVPGHEVAGIVTAVGSEVTKFKVGDRVGVGCFVDSCTTCATRDLDYEHYMPGLVQTYNDVEADGKTPTFGGYSDSIVVKEGYVLSFPDNIPLYSGAPLLCAGITLFSPLRHWKAGPGKKVAIVGMGGLGHMGVKLAHAMGADVTVLSQTLSKKEDGFKLGAKDYYATSDAETFTKLAGTFDLIINTVGTAIDWNAYLNLLKYDGSMVLVGVPEHAVPVHAFSLIPGRRSLSGSMIGSIKETQEMLDFCGEHNIVAEIEKINIQEINEAYERVLKSDVRYRFVIDIASLA